MLDLVRSRGVGVQRAKPAVPGGHVRGREVSEVLKKR